MTLFFRIAGVDLGNTRVRLNGFELSQAADGGYAGGGVTIEDPDGILDIDGWQLFEVDETACSSPRTYTGWIYGRNINRGPKYRVGSARIWDCDLVDLNAMLHFEPLQGNRDDARRPAETGTERITWLMGTTWMDGYVFDNGSVMANAWEYDETDYRGQYPDDVLRDIVSASGVGRWTTFLYWDDTATAGQEVSLFYGQVAAILNTSTLRISNESTDVDGVTTFAPSIDGNMFRDPSERYGSVYVDAVPGNYYRTNPTTIADMALTAPNGLSMIRGGTYTSERLINVETVNRHANTYLDWHSVETDKITCTVRLPASKVNLLQAGMRVECKFEHLPGYESFTFMRVSRRTVRQAPNDDSQYDVYLELSTKGVLQSGGGDPGDFPTPGCVEGTGGQVWGESFDNGGIEILSYTAPQTPAVGNTLVIHEAYRQAAAGNPQCPVGFTDSGEGPVTAHETDGRVCYRIVQSGDTDTITWAGGGGGPQIIYAEELVGQLTPEATSAVSADPYNLTSMPGAPITPTAGRLGVIKSYAFFKRGNTPYGAGTGWTELDDFFTAAVLQQIVIEKAVTSTTGTYTPEFTGGGPPPVFDGHSYGSITTAWLCQSSGDPSPGQWIYGETPTPAPGGGTVTFSTAHPFADGSLQVFVDITDQTAAIVSYDGAAGTFTLAFDPRADEVITVNYQGR